MPSLAEVLRCHWPQYERQFGADILPSHRRAVQAIMACRTGVLGGELHRCATCQKDHFVYHSCNHRACPQCGNADAAQWVEQQKLRLLPVPYYLITFTVPEGLRAWLRSHQQDGYGLLLQQSAATLQDVASRDKYLGAELGLLSVLHTWGRQLQYHPHVHCVVPAGGLRPDRSRWRRPASPDFFLPQIVLAARFRNRLRTALQALPDVQQIRPAIWKQKWVVDVRHVGSGERALQYLSAYVYRTALGAHKILADDNGSIRFKYKDSQDRQWRTLTLNATEFIRRFLQHVLPRGFQRVRHYGWMAGAASAKWKQILLLLNWKVQPSPPQTPRPQAVCESCGGPLFLVGRFKRGPP